MRRESPQPLPLRAERAPLPPDLVRTERFPGRCAAQDVTERLHVEGAAWSPQEQSQAQPAVQASPGAQGGRQAWRLVGWGLLGCGVLSAAWGFFGLAYCADLLLVGPVIGPQSGLVRAAVLSLALLACALVCLWLRARVGVLAAGERRPGAQASVRT